MPTLAELRAEFKALDADINRSLHEARTLTRTPYECPVCRGGGCARCDDNGVLSLDDATALARKMTNHLGLARRAPADVEAAALLESPVVFDAWMPASELADHLRVRAALVRRAGAERRHIHGHRIERRAAEEREARHARWLYRACAEGAEDGAGGYGPASSAASPDAKGSEFYSDPSDGEGSPESGDPWRTASQLSCQLGTYPARVEKAARTSGRVGGLCIEVRELLEGEADELGVHANTKRVYRAVQPSSVDVSHLEGWMLASDLAPLVGRSQEWVRLKGHRRPTVAIHTIETVEPTREELRALGLAIHTKALYRLVPADETNRATYPHGGSRDGEGERTEGLQGCAVPDDENHCRIDNGSVIDAVGKPHGRELHEQIGTNVNTFPAREPARVSEESTPLSDSAGSTESVPAFDAYKDARKAARRILVAVLPSHMRSAFEVLESLDEEDELARRMLASVKARLSEEDAALLEAYLDTRL